MHNALSIARRELKTYFHSPVAYIVLAFFLIAACTLFFMVFQGGVFVNGRASTRGFFALVPWLFVILCPAVTMRLIAEERKSGTLEVLMTLPVTEAEVVVGKFLAALGLVATGLVFTLPVPITLASIVEEGFSFDWGPAIGGYLGLLLLASAFIAIGMFGSAITKNQIVSFIIAAALCLFLVIVDWLAFFMPKSVAPFFQFLSVTWHFENIARGVIDSRDLIFYLSLTFVGLRLTVSALRSARQ